MVEIGVSQVRALKMRVGEVELMLRPFAFQRDQAASENGQDGLNVSTRLSRRGRCWFFTIGDHRGVLANVGGEDLHDGPVVAR